MPLLTANEYKRRHDNRIAKRDKSLLKRGFRRVGIAGVDTASILIGDPSYFIHSRTKWRELRSSWEAFCHYRFSRTRHEAGSDTHMQLRYDHGHAGLGVILGLGGDGTAHVYVRERGGVAVEARIFFD